MSTPHPAGADRKFATVQMLRGFAAGIVLLCHVLCCTTGSSTVAITLGEKLLWRMGDFGVDIFFCISGFVIVLTRPRSDHRVSDAASFLSARVLRIYPLYLFWLTAYLISLHLLRMAPALATAHPATDLTAMALVRNILLLPSVQSYILNPVWTLSYEMYFYITFALLLLVWGRRNVFWALAILLGGAFALFQWLLVAPQNAALAALGAMMGDPLIWNFLMGAGIAKLPRPSLHQRHAARSPVIWTLMAVTAAGALLLPEELPRLFRLGLPGAAILYMALHASPGSGALSRALLYGGEASYSIYITHVFFAFLARQWLRLIAMLPMAVPPLASGLVLAAIAVAFGCLSYELIEKRVIRNRLAPHWPLIGRGKATASLLT